MSGHGLTIYASNRLETLVGQLAGTMAKAPLGPLEREVIVVQSRGIYRWLTLELARRLGIAATIATPFPGTFCRALSERIELARNFPGARVPGPGERYEPAGPSPFERDVLEWRIFRLLAAGEEEIVRPAAAYTKDDPDQRKRFQLAGRLAARFDEYQLYRPELLAAWELGEQPITRASHRGSAEWQGALWRALVNEAGDGPHLGRRFGDLVRDLREGKVPADVLPRRLSVFGAPTLPPVFLDVLAALANHAAVAVYVVSPTPHYWADIRSPREAAAALARFNGPQSDEADRHFTVGHPLLASLGRQGRELALLLHERDETGSAWQPLAYEASAQMTVLATIQNDVMNLVERGHTAECEPPLRLAGDDRSLEIHVCHSPMREMQVVRDVILDAFAGDAGLRPDDVFVLAPDIGRYSAYIDAVFGVTNAGEPRLKYSVADRSMRAAEPIVDAAFRILELARSRATASDVMSLLDTAAIRRAAALSSEEIAMARDWIGSTNVRWGIDGEHRRSLGLPADDFDTWRAGVDRLLLGYAMGDEEAVVAGIVPLGAATAEAEALGRFAGFLERLFDHARKLREPRTLEEWSQSILAAFDDLLDAEDDAEESALRALRDCVAKLAEAFERARVREIVHLEVVLEQLRQALARGGGGAGFLNGAITFCGLTPMRAIPAKLIVVAGLEDGAFPRRERPPSFDLVAAAPRPGDRSPREDDRYAFLETLLAARRRLVITYVGRSQKDNAELAPSSVVSELVATIDRTFVADAERASDHLTRIHPLQPFSERYFEAGGDASPELFSYSQASCRGALAARSADDTVPAPFSARPLEPSADVTDIALADLLACFENPAKYFCTRVVGLRLPDERAEFEDSEPFTLDNLAQYKMLDTLVARRIAGLVAGEVEQALLQATAALPHAATGRARLEATRREAEAFVASVRAAADGEVAYLEPVVIDVAGKDWRLVGRIEHVTPRGLLMYRPATLKPKDRLRAWLRHLGLCAWAASERERTGRLPGIPCLTRVVAKNTVVEIAAVPDPLSLLDVLVRRYREGLSGPLPLFERASYAFAEQERKLAAHASSGKKNTRLTTPIKHAEAEFGTLRRAPGEITEASSHGRKDADDAYVRLAWRDQDPLGEDGARFEALARELWHPFFELATETGGEDAAS